MKKVTRSAAIHKVSAILSRLLVILILLFRDVAGGGITQQSEDKAPLKKGNRPAAAPPVVC